MNKNTPKWSNAIQQIIFQDPGHRGIQNLLPAAPQHFYTALEKLHKSKHVTCISGFSIPPPETDGPLGSAAIVRYLVRNMGKKVAMVVDSGCEKVQRAAMESALRDCTKEQKQLLQWKIYQVGDDEQNTQQTKDILKQTDCLLSIEHLGLAKDGKKYSMKAADKSHLNASTHQLFLQRNKDTQVALSVGDGGNELGFGLVRDAVVKHIPKGDIIGDTVPCDYLIPCGVSNWAGHGLAAGLTLLQLSLLPRETLLEKVFPHVPRREWESLSTQQINDILEEYLTASESIMNTLEELDMLDAIIKAGSTDGITGKGERSIDGMAYEPVHSKILKDIRQVCVEQIHQWIKSEE